MSNSQTPQDLPPGSDTVVLVGNPNVGKSVLFKNLTHRYVVVSNFPGTTVDVSRARATLDGHEVEVIDTPGINDLCLRSEDARVTRQILDHHAGATLVQVADAKNLRRALLLTLQLAESGHRLVLVLNMFDELRERGGRIDTEHLSEILGVPVVTTVAAHNLGTRKTIAAVPVARRPHVDLSRVAAVDDEYEKNHARLALVNEILAETYSISQPRQASLRVRLGFWAMHPVKGVGLLLLVLVAAFWFVGLFGAGTLVDLFEMGVFQRWINPAAIRLTDALLPFDHTHEVTAAACPLALPLTPVNEWQYATIEMTMVTPEYTLGAAERSWGERIRRFVHDFLVGEFGVITMALSYAFAIILPIVTTFFLLFSILEDSGYLPRMAIMVNRIFRLMGLNGKAVLPMILGLGCDTMATMTTRILETRKERIVTTMLLALAVPCSAQLGILLAMLAKLSLLAALCWLVLIIVVLFTVGALTARLFGGDRSDFVLEIPPIRWPQPGNVRVKTLSRLIWYLREVIPLFVLGTAILFVLDQIDLLALVARAGEPLVSGWLGLPREMANAFIVGFLRRDFGAVYLLDAATGPEPILSRHQIFVSIITITLFMPCIANFLMIAKEHGLRIALAMAAFIFPFAFFVGGLVNHLAP